MTTLNEQSKNVLGRIINKEQGRLELQAANRMSNFRQDLDRLIDTLEAARVAPQQPGGMSVEFYDRTVRQIEGLRAINRTLGHSSIAQALGG